MSDTNTSDSYQPRTSYGRVLKRVYNPKYRDLHTGSSSQSDSKGGLDE